MGESSERLREARIRAGFKSARKAANRFNWKYSTYASHENGQTDVPPDMAREYARAFKTSAGWLLTGEGSATVETVPIVGIAGASADGGISYEFESGELGEAPTVPSGTKRTVAVEVRGDSLRGRVEDGWLVYYDNRQEPLTEDMAGELCIVGLEDGRTLLKTPYRGRGRGLWDLESTNAPTMRDVAVKWAAVVTAIVPRRLMRRRA